MRETLDEPSHLQVEVTNRCNLKCLTCPHWAVTDVGDFPIRRLEQILDQFQRPPCEVLLQGLGEPLLHPGLEDMVRACHARGVGHTFIYTNGVLLRPARADALATAGLSELRLSMDGSDEESLRRVRPGVRLEAVVGYMQHVVQRTGMATALQFTATSETIDALPRLPALAARMGVKRVVVVDVVPFADRETVTAAPLSTQDHRIPLMSGPRRAAILEEFRERSREEGLDVVESLDSSRAVCDSPMVSLYVNWKGDVTPCCRIHYDVRLGNLFEQRMIDVWQGAAMTAWRNRLRSDDPPHQCRRLCQLGSAAAPWCDRLAS